VIVVGGLGSIQGALVAGLALGIVNSISVGYLPAGWYDVIVWSLLLVVVLARPSGLFSQVGAEVRAVRR
jgi:branched-chain amino acid transport system permease protein